MKTLIFELAVSTLGLIVMFTIDWKFALGVMLLMWGNNMMIFRKIK